MIPSNCRVPCLSVCLFVCFVRNFSAFSIHFNAVFLSFIVEALFIQSSSLSQGNFSIFSCVFVLPMKRDEFGVFLYHHLEPHSKSLCCLRITQISEKEISGVASLIFPFLLLHISETFFTFWNKIGEKSSVSYGESLR